MKYYYTIRTSRGGSDKQWRAGLSSEQNLIRFARDECYRCGETLEELAGIETIEDTKGNLAPVREWQEGEELKTAVEKLSSGRVYMIYDADRTSRAEFIAEAEKYGVAEEARDLV